MKEPDPTVDIDLSALSSTMVYSEVLNIMTFPDEYVGKSMRMLGIFSSYTDEETGKTYCACIIPDATACCAQGIEFETTSDYVYPDDFPEEGGIVRVKGVFDTYEEGSFTYCTLRDSVLLEVPANS